MYSFSRGADSLLIGRIFGAAAVGLYSRGSILLIRPLEQLIVPIYAVLIPTLSRLQDRADQYRRTFLEVFEGIALITFLFTGPFLPLSYPVTVAVLGPKWEAAAPIFAGFTVAALAYPLVSASIWLFWSQGRGKDWVLDKFDHLECQRLFLPGRIAVRSRRSGDILFGVLCPDTGASCLLHRRQAGSGQQDRPLDCVPAASACMGNSLRDSLPCPHFRVGGQSMDPIIALRPPGAAGWRGIHCSFPSFATRRGEPFLRGARLEKCPHTHGRVRSAWLTPEYISFCSCSCSVFSKTEVGT